MPRGATVVDADGLVALPGPRRPAHAPARAGLRAERDGAHRHAGRRGGRVHGGLRHGEHVPGRRHRRRRRAGGSPRPTRPATPPCSPIGAVTVGLKGERLAELGAMARLARERARLQRRRLLRLRPAAHAPRARVREGVRRRHRPARAGAAAHRGRADERGRPVGASSASPAGPPSPRSRSSRATCCSPSTSAAACTSATSRPPDRSRSSAGRRRRGIDVTAEVTPHHLLLTEELVRGYDARFKVNPPLRRAEDVEALRAAPRRRHDRHRRDRPRAAPGRGEGVRVGAAANGMVGLECALARRAAAVVDTGLLDWADVARVLSRRPGAHRPPRRPRARRSRPERRRTLTLYDPAAASDVLDVDRPAPAAA